MPDQQHIQRARARKGSRNVKKDLSQYRTNLPVENNEELLTAKALLSHMIGRLHTLLRLLDISAHGRPPYLYWLREALHQAHRVILIEEHIPEERVNFVGFFGKKRSDLSSVLVDEISRFDEQIVRNQLRRGLLSYSSMELPDDNWCNLVLFRDAQAQAQLRESQDHSVAAFQLAPLCYRQIHIYTGIHEGGLASGTFQVERSLLYTFGNGS
jgi:hypothetical protein